MAESKSAALPLGYAPASLPTGGSRGGADHNGCAIGPQPARAKRDLGATRGAQPSVSQLGIGRLMWRARPAYAARSIGGAARAETVAMRKLLPATFVACLGLALVWAPAVGTAASFECAARFLSQAQIAICRDAQLSRADEQTARRVASLSRRLAFGQYLGLRHWHNRWVEHRDGCRADRGCLTASYRALGISDRKGLKEALDRAPARC